MLLMLSPAPPPADGFLPRLVAVFRQGYGGAALRHDLVAGLTVAVVALPLSMGIAIACGLPPEKGLFAAIIGGGIISALGGSLYQIGGPAGAFIVLIASIVERQGYEGLLRATLLAGVLMLGMGALRLGRFIRLMPAPVILGFTAGIAVIIFASQFKELLGLTLAREPAAFLPKLAALTQAAGTLNLQAALVAWITLGLIVSVQRRWARGPAFLVGLAVASALVQALGLEVATIGTRFGALAASLPVPRLPDLDPALLLRALPDAFAIALLGAVESLLSALVADRMGQDSHHPSAELNAQGLANLAGACFLAMPVTGTIARTAANIRAGAVSPVAGIMHAGLLVLFMGVAAPLAAFIPLPALGAMLAVVAWNMSEHHHVLAVLRDRRGPALVLLATFLLTVLVDLVAGIGAGLALTLLLRWLRPQAMS